MSEHDGDTPFPVKAGNRMPYFLSDGGSVYDKLRDPKFHLLTFSDGTSDYQALHTEIEREFAGQVACIVVPLYPHVAEIFGTDKPFHVLLRPDNYLAFLTHEMPLERLRDYLAKISRA